MNVGIDDGAEFEYWQDYLHKLWDGWVNEETGAEVNETVVDYLKDPDVDKDNVTDGKEINGWTVKIIVGYDEQNNPISKEVTLYGDPLAPYREPRKENGELGDYIDSDEDNIPDIVESLLSNNSTFAKFARLFADPTSEYYDLWTSYNWTIAYFFSVRNNRNFHYYLDLLDADKYSAEEIAIYITGWNNTAPHNKSCAENATEWLRDEFNPLITESMAPVITEFHVMTVYRGEVFPGVPNAKAKIVLEIRDVAGISDVRIRSICPDITGIMIWTIDMDFNGETSVIIGKDEPFYIDVTEYSAVLTYNISVNATDTLGNSAEWYKEVDGPFGAFIKTVANMLRAFWDFLCEVGKVLAKALEILIEWIVSFVKEMINKFLETLKNFLKGFVNDLYRVFQESFAPLLNILGSRQESDAESYRVARQCTVTFITNSIIQHILYAIFGLAITIQIIEFAVMVFSNTVPGLSLILSAVLSGVIMGLLLGVSIVIYKNIMKPNDLFKENEAFWCGGLGLAIQGAYNPIMELIKSIGEASWNVDLIGLTIAAFSLAISAISGLITGISLWFINWFSFILAAIGWGFTLMTAPTDVPSNPLWWVEEVISTLSMSYAIGILLYDSDHDGTPNGLDTSP